MSIQAVCSKLCWQSHSLNSIRNGCESRSDRTELDLIFSGNSKACLFKVFASSFRTGLNFKDKSFKKTKRSRSFSYALEVHSPLFENAAEIYCFWAFAKAVEVRWGSLRFCSLVKSAITWEKKLKKQQFRAEVRLIWRISRRIFGGIGAVISLFLEEENAFQEHLQWNRAPSMR